MIPGSAVVPFLLPGIVASVLVSLLVAGAVGRALNVRWGVAWLLVCSFGVILAATLMPHKEAFDGIQGSGTCDFSRLGLAPLRDLLKGYDAGLNVLIFIPFGVAIAMVPRSRPKAALLVGAVALPFLIETAQLLVPAINRSCQSADVVDNLTGLVIGLAAGALVAWLVPGLRRPVGRPSSAASE
jgi:hypothetical protein